METLTIKKGFKLQTPNYVGGYRMGIDADYFQFNLTHKPNWFHRTMMRIFFDAHWFDN